jgi:hypothetical protein
MWHKDISHLGVINKVKVINLEYGDHEPQKQGSRINLESSRKKQCAECVWVDRGWCMWDVVDVGVRGGGIE